MKVCFMGVKKSAVTQSFITLSGTNPALFPDPYPGKKNLLPFIVPLQATLL